MQGNGKTSQAAATTPQDVVATPQAVAMTPQAVAMTPQDVAATPQAAAMTPQAAAMTPQAAAMTPQAAAMTPQVVVRSQRTLAYHAKASMEQRLLAAQVAIEGVLADVALQTALVPYGYDLDRMLQGKALLDQAQALVQQQRARTGDQHSAVDTRDTTQTQAHAFYMRQLTVARVALRGDRGAAQALGLAAARKRTFAGWLMQAQQFYGNALNNAVILEKLAAYGMTREQLELGQSQVAEVAARVVTHQQRKDVKQEATRARDAALRALDDWMRDFNTIARVALAEMA